MVDLEALTLPRAVTPPSGTTWWFYAWSPLMPDRKIRVTLDTGAMAVAVSLKFASMIIRAQEEREAGI